MGRSSSSSDHHKGKKHKKYKKICIPLDLDRVASRPCSFTYTGPSTSNVCCEQLSIVNTTAGGVTLVFPQCPLDGMQQTVRAAISPNPNFITINTLGSFIENPASPGTLPPATQSVSFVGGLNGEGYTFTYARYINTWVITSRTGS